MNPEERIRMLLQALSTGMLESPYYDAPRPAEMFSDGIPSLADINTPVYETDAEYLGGPTYPTLTPPAAAPKRGSRDSMAAAHQRSRKARRY